MIRCNERLLADLENITVTLFSDGQHGLHKYVEVGMMRW